MNRPVSPHAPAVFRLVALGHESIIGENMTNILKPFAAAACGATMVFASALASDFEAACVERTPGLHPDMDDVEGACACVASTADDDTLAEIQNASSPDELGDDAKEAMQACGFSV